MTSNHLSPSNRDRRALGVGLAIVATLVVAGRGYPAWTAWAATRRATAAATVERAVFATQASRSLGAMRDSAVARGERLNRLGPSLFAASSLTEAGAALARAVSEVATENGVQLLALSIRPDSTRNARAAPVAVRLTVDTDHEGLVGVLRDLEGADAIFAIRELLIENGEAEPERLRAELLIEALALVDRPRADTSTQLHRIQSRR